jgi:hypothetical protein
VKVERESRIDREEVPEKALNFIERLGDTSNEKWYSEENLDGKAIEVKMKRFGSRYSVKFTTEGNLVDVERDLKWRQIPEEVAEEIIEELEEEFDKLKWEKIQIQFIADPEEMLAYLKKNKEKDEIETYYEIVFQGKKEGSYKLYEFLFDYEGEIVERSRILPRNTDNLEF